MTVSKAQQRRDFDGCLGELVDGPRAEVTCKSHSLETTALEWWAGQTRTRGQEASGGMRCVAWMNPGVTIKA